MSVSLCHLSHAVVASWPRSVTGHNIGIGGNTAGGSRCGRNRIAVVAVMATACIAVFGSKQLVY
jgi:hypothetical protein